jgi:hypothetical protein
MYMYTNPFLLFGVSDFPLHGIYHFDLLVSFKGPLSLSGSVSVNFATNYCGSPAVINVFLCL